MKTFKQLQLFQEELLQEKNTILDIILVDVKKLQNKAQHIALSIDNRLGKKLDDKFDEIQNMITDLEKIFRDRSK